MRGWLGTCLALVLALGLSGCSPEEQGHDELVQTYLEAIVDGRLADAAALHTSFGEDARLVPRDAYLAAEGRVDGFTIDEVTERAARVTLHAGRDSRSGTLHITQEKIWDTWIWFEMSFSLPPMADAALNGAAVARQGEVQSLAAPAGSFELTADAGPLLEVYPGSWSFGLDDPPTPRTTRVLEMWLSDAGQVEADRQLSVLLDGCAENQQADPWCPWHTLGPSPGAAPWVIDMVRIAWQRCSWEVCPGLVDQVLVSTTAAEDGEEIVSGAVLWSATVEAGIAPDGSLTVEVAPAA